MLAIQRILERFFFLFTITLLLRQDEVSKMNFPLDVPRLWKVASSCGSTSRCSSTTRASTPRKQQSDDATPIQIIAGRYIDGEKLQDVLHNKFGSDYRLQVSSPGLSDCDAVFVSGIDPSTDAIKYVSGVRAGKTLGG
jgi:hypothetical protein